MYALAFITALLTFSISSPPNRSLPDQHYCHLWHFCHIQRVYPSFWHVFQVRLPSPLACSPPPPPAVLLWSSTMTIACFITLHKHNGQQTVGRVTSRMADTTSHWLWVLKSTTRNTSGLSNVGALTVPVRVTYPSPAEDRQKTRFTSRPQVAFSPPSCS